MNEPANSPKSCVGGEKDGNLRSDSNPFLPISERVKAVRHSYNLSQVEFAKLLGITQGSLSALERGSGRRPIKRVVKKLAEYLDMDIIELAMMCNYDPNDFLRTDEVNEDELVSGLSSLSEEKQSMVSELSMYLDDPENAKMLRGIIAICESIASGEDTPERQEALALRQLCQLKRFLVK